MLGCGKSKRRDEGGCGEVLGRGVGKCAGMWEREGKMWGVGKSWERCEKVYWGVGEVRGDVG